MVNFLERFLPGNSAAIRSLRDQVERLNAPRNLAIVRTVLIVGESGVGKTYAARVIAAHREALTLEEGVLEDNTNLDSFLGGFDEINLPNLPENLIESELFGHVKGAFTGADKEKQGLLSPESKQTKSDILLDEIGDASPVLQAKLLQVSESGRFRKLGALPGDDERTEARLMFATNRDLASEVRSGRFREDLLWRLNAVTLEIPPLRYRRDQVTALLQAVLRDLLRISSEAPLSEQDVNFSQEDLEWAQTYDWPGNVRELKSLVLRWLVEGGERPLREMVLAELHSRSQSPGVGERTSLIVARLESGKPIGSLSQLLAEDQKEAKRQVLQWYDRTRPTTAELESKFPGVKARSVRNKLSDWRRELE